MKAYKDINEYIDAFPEKTQILLNKMRKTIQEAAPEATEVIAYGIPTFKLHGNLVHFGGYKSHIGFYPAPRGIEAFKAELKNYQGGKGTIKFPLDQPIPYELVTRIVKFRVAEVLKNKKK